jgi:hypothetical protein
VPIRQLSQADECVVQAVNQTVVLSGNREEQSVVRALPCDADHTPSQDAC